MADNHNLTIERLINAPLEDVWQAWTDPAKIQQWWGPRGVTNPTCVWEARPGGRIDIVMLAGSELGEMAGQEWPMTGEFVEVVPQQKLVYTASPLANGKPLFESSTTLMFEAQGDQTKLTMFTEVTNTTPEAADALSGMEAGWNQSLDKLTEQVEKEA